MLNVLTNLEAFEVLRWWHALNYSHLSLVDLNTSIPNSKAQKFSQHDIKYTLERIHLQLELAQSLKDLTKIL